MHTASYLKLLKRCYNYRTHESYASNMYRNISAKYTVLKIQDLLCAYVTIYNYTEGGLTQHCSMMIVILAKSCLFWSVSCLVPSSVSPELSLIDSTRDGQQHDPPQIVAQRGLLSSVT